MAGKIFWREIFWRGNLPKSANHVSNLNSFTFKQQKGSFWRENFGGKDFWRERFLAGKIFGGKRLFGGKPRFNLPDLIKAKG